MKSKKQKLKPIDYEILYDSEYAFRFQIRMPHRIRDDMKYKDYFELKDRIHKVFEPGMHEFKIIEELMYREIEKKLPKYVQVVRKNL